MFDKYFETVNAWEDQETPVWSELIAFQPFKSVYNDKDYVLNLSDEWLDTSALEARRHQESQRNSKTPVQE